jgi:hypothetical protein
MIHPIQTSNLRKPIISPDPGISNQAPIGSIKFFLTSNPFLQCPSHSNNFPGFNPYVLNSNIPPKARGGTVFQKKAVIGKAQMTQVTIGFQFGGQAYREVIFFENKITLDQFKENKIEFSAQVSAVAAKAGASGNVKYTNGVLIFTQQKGGLMYEASVGGQKFKYTAY